MGLTRGEFPRFYPIVDSAWSLAPADAAEAVLEAGARILQFRHKGFFSREVFDQAQRIAALCRAAGTLFVMNDRADMAMLLESALHLGQDDLPPAAARRILAPGTMLGFSTHNAEQLTAAGAEPVDYLATGPIFATGTKVNPDPVVGLEELRALRKLTDKPLVAIGGITRQTAAQVLDAGADSLAVIGDLCPNPLTKASLRARAEEWVAICRTRT